MSYLHYIYNGKRREANRQLADEAKWPRLDRIFVDLTPSRRLACAVSGDNDAASRKLYFPSGRARRPSQRNYLLRSTARRRPAPVLLGRPRTRHARPAARRDGQPCPTVGRSGGRGTGNAFPTHSATDRQVSTTSTVLPARPRAATYVPPIDTHPSLSGGVPPNLASFYPADSKSVGNRYDQ